jgi:hypothetical protein
MPRPAKSESETQVKKGKPSWAPATALQARKIPGFRTRWINKDPMNVQRKEAEGWEVVHADKGLQSEHEHPGDLSSGKPVTSVTEYRELVLAALPEEVAQAREAYFTEQTDKQTASLKSNVQKDLASGGAAVHGKIIIE